MKATDIMHPEDAKAIQMIKSVPGYEKLVRLFMKLGYEMQYRGENLANMVRVTPHCYPQIYGLFKEVVNKTGIKEPELYIYNDPEMNAYTYGETRTFVALSSSIVEKLTPEELKGIMAHECGHNTKHLSIPRYGAESNKSIAVYSTRIRSCVPVLWK